MNNYAKLIFIIGIIGIISIWLSSINQEPPVIPIINNTINNNSTSIYLTLFK